MFITRLCTASLTAVVIVSVLSSTSTMKDRFEETSLKYKHKNNTFFKFIAENEGMLISVRYPSIQTINLGVCITGSYLLNQNVLRLDKICKNNITIHKLQ